MLELPEVETLCRGDKNIVLELKLLKKHGIFVSAHGRIFFVIAST
jgi:hypothetical protein